MARLSTASAASFTASDSGFAATFGLEFSPIHRTMFLYYVILALALFVFSAALASIPCAASRTGPITSSTGWTYATGRRCST